MTITAASVALFALAVPAVAPAQTNPGAFQVDTTRDDDDGECARDCTLREAVGLAGGGTGTPILLPAGVYKLTRPLAIRNDNTTIYGAGFLGQQSSGARTTIIDGNGSTRVLELPPELTAILAGVTITGGRATNGAGALVGSGGTLFLYNSIVRDNVASTRGGGVQAVGTLELIQTTVSDNRALAGAGGGIAVDATGSLYAVTSTISGNTASAGGGAIATAGSFQLHNVTVAGGLLGEPGSSGGSNVLTNTVLTGPGASCGGTIAGAPRFGWTGNLASDPSCQFAPGEGVQSQDPRLGQLTNNKGATDTMALLANSPAIDTGDPNFCVGIDQRGANSVGTCDKGAFEYKGVVPEAQLPPPTPGETANVFKARGTVRIKLPGSSEFIDLEGPQQIPVGTTFDTSKGRVTLIAAANTQGKTQKAWFYQGVFKFSQSKGRKPLTTLAMTGKLQCGGGGKANAAAKKKRTRRLWGDGKGRFRTKGKHSAATVVGTKWLVEDRCNGTLTKVLRGKVSVRDFKRRKTITVRAGHQYFAKR